MAGTAVLCWWWLNLGSPHRCLALLGWSLPANGCLDHITINATHTVLFWCCLLFSGLLLTTTSPTLHLSFTSSAAHMQFCLPYTSGLVAPAL
ncbi:hypothetical protein B0H16DRAFT_1566029 [Mycena metata]|uniref:Secreted protein n=1 Tax=Mycena metata TaxID=1033252 RepID=A0AAD7IGF6_9AGAR|nr:hypothetical protein B0H16DRAFT_1566029 [Mycena metata]